MSSFNTMLSYRARPCRKKKKRLGMSLPDSALTQHGRKPGIVRSLTEGKEERGKRENENRFQLFAWLTSKALLLRFHWENLFPVMEAKGLVLCLAPQRVVMELQQGNLPSPHPRCLEPACICGKGAVGIINPRALCMLRVYSATVQQPGSQNTQQAPHVIWTHVAVQVTITKIMILVNPQVQKQCVYIFFFSQRLKATTLFLY